MFVKQQITNLSAKKWCAIEYSIGRIFQRRTTRPFVLKYIRINHLVIKIQPNRLVFAAIVSAAGFWAKFTNVASTRTPLQMRSIAVLLLLNDVRLAEIPMYHSLMNILFGQCERQPATGSLTKMETTFAVDFGLGLESIFVEFRFL